MNNSKFILLLYLKYVLRYFHVLGRYSHTPSVWPDSTICDFQSNFFAKSLTLVITFEPNEIEIFGMHTLLIKRFPVTPRSMTMWPWPWPCVLKIAILDKKLTLFITLESYEIERSYLVCILCRCSFSIDTKVMTLWP